MNAIQELKTLMQKYGWSQAVLICDDRYTSVGATPDDDAEASYFLHKLVGSEVLRVKGNGFEYEPPSFYWTPPVFRDNVDDADNVLDDLATLGRKYYIDKLILLVEGGDGYYSVGSTPIRDKEASDWLTSKGYDNGEFENEPLDWYWGRD